MVLEYQPEGSLMNSLEKSKTFQETEVRIIMEQLLLALDFFEKKKVVHRDIKLDNILIKQIEEGGIYEIRIADFGLATFTLRDE
jgi:serine/threonine protein kinase